MSDEQSSRAVEDEALTEPATAPVDPDGPTQALPAAEPDAPTQTHPAPDTLSLEAQIEQVQQRLRAAARRRAALLDAGDHEALATLDEDMALLRRQRQALHDSQLQQRRESAAAREREVVVTPAPLPVANRRRVQGAQAQPPLAVRLMILLLVLVGVGAVTLGGISFVLNRLQPPPIAGMDGLAEAGNEEEFSVTDGSFEQRGLAIYLALNRDKIQRAPSDDPTPVVFTVEPGETAGTIAERLQAEGLVEDADLFRRLIRYRGADQSIEAGVFQLARNMTMDDIILALQQGRLEETTVTLPEGWRAAEMAEALEAAGLVDADEYLALVEEPSRFTYDFLAGLPEGSTLEGYLFPDTYRVVAGETTAESFIRLQLETFDTRVPAALREAVADKGLTLHQAITLASIVEREAVVPEERELIAGVYINRLMDGTVLNADPTIQYALGYQAGSEAWWKRPLTREDLEADTPYNTYTRPGLPPTPISNPGLDTIRATILAPDTDFYYFVSRNDGTHVFATSYEEHLQNVQQFQSNEVPPP